MQSARIVNIQDLIYTTNYVSDGVSVREIKIWFQTQPNVRSLAVLNVDGSFGIVTREKFNAAMVDAGGASDFYSRNVSFLMNGSPYVAIADTPIPEVMESLLSARREGEDFFEDILVCDALKKFVGLVSVKDIVVDQLVALMHRLTAMEAQQAALARQNKELFENSFKQSQSETQFRSYFDHAPIPVVVFSREGRCLTANRRFYRLADLARHQLDGRMMFDQLFKQTFAEVQGACASVPQQDLLLRGADGETMPVQAVVEVSVDWGHLLVSIMGLGSREDDAAIHSPGEILVSTSEKPPGKITQAIREKIKTKEATPLGRSVASNLIDREEQVERLMKKLEQIFSVATEIERHPASEPLPDEEVVDQRQHLKGHIAEFSVIDLCQILIQGSKTGQLLIHAHSEEELTAYIYFYCGGIVHAKHKDGFEGELSMPRIVAIKTGTFDFIFNKATPKTTIQGSAMALLMDACRKADEAASA